ncbi:MAG: hypothetical protein V7727_14320 [Sneathiella sp.]
MTHLEKLAAAASGPVLFAFDFPFGYPAGSQMGGGKATGRRIANLLHSDDQDRNNRFEVADILNGQIAEADGPFWGCPKAKSLKNLTTTKPAFTHTAFAEWRLVEKRLRDRGKRIMNVWQLLGQGSVGSQTLTGLAELFSFSEKFGQTKSVRFWPFETNWDEQLDDIILAEVWPSLNDFDRIDHPIKDARQVIACLNWLWDHNARGSIKRLFAAPDDLDKDARLLAQNEEGWILGLSDL